MTPEEIVRFKDAVDEQKPDPRIGVDGECPGCEECCGFKNMHHAKRTEPEVQR